MSWIGKLLGAVFGFLAAGPVGAVAGLVVGHYFDLASKGLFKVTFTQHTHSQEIFFRTTFSILGHIAKADGRVSENEIRVATAIMKKMLLTKGLKQQAIHYFNLGKSPNFNLDEALAQLQNACYHQPNLMHLFMDIQLQGALADGSLSPAKQRILSYMSAQLGLNPNDFLFRQSYQHQSHQRRQSYQPSPRPDALADAYRLLGVSKSTSAVDVKKAYRRLMSQNHPDKLVAKGLPEEMIKMATQKTQEIKAAYELVSKHGAL